MSSIPPLTLTWRWMWLSSPRHDVVVLGFTIDTRKPSSRPNVAVIAEPNVLVHVWRVGVPSPVPPPPASGVAPPASGTPASGVPPPPLHTLCALAELRGAGAAVVKSAALLSVSVQPPPARNPAVVLASVGASPLPSKLSAL